MMARDVERDMLARCAAIATGAGPTARDAREANVFRVAAMISRTRFPEASDRLWKASSAWFALHPDDQMHASDVVQNGWIFSFPRLRDMLGRELLHGQQASQQA